MNDFWFGGIKEILRSYVLKDVSFWIIIDLFRIYIHMYVQ